MALTERLAVLIDAKANGLREFSKAGDAADDLDRKTGKARGAMEKLGLAGAASGTALKTGLVAGAAAGAAGLAALGKSGVDAYVGLADSVRTFQRASGATAEESSRFVAVLDDLEISAETGAKAVGKLARIDPSKLREFGVEVARNADGSQNLEQTLLNVADAYSTTKDPAARAQLAFAAFGKQGQDLIPVLEQGRGGLAAFFAEAEGNHQILSQEELDKAREYELAMDALGDAASGLQRQIGQGLLPTVIELTENTTGFLNAVDSVTEPVGGLSNVVSHLAEAANPLNAIMGLFGDESEEAGDKQGQAATKVAETNARLREQKAALEETTAAQQEAIEATIASFSSEIAHEQAINRVTDAQADLTEKQKALTEAQRVHGESSAEAAEAAKALRDAEIGLRDASLGAAGAAARVADDQAKAAGSALNAEQKTLAFRNQLAALRDQAAPGSGLRANLDAFIGRLDAAGRDRHVNVFANTRPAYDSVDELIRWIYRREASIKVFGRVAGVNGVGGIPISHGGDFISSGMPRFPWDAADERTRRLQVGEVVLSRDDVAAARAWSGGTAAVPARGGVAVTVNVDARGAVDAPRVGREVALAVRDELLQLKRSGMAVGLA